MSKQILIVAGGTGGHLYPGIALAHTMAARGWQPSFVVRRGDLGRGVLKGEGFPVYELSGQGLPRKLSWKMLTFPYYLVTGFREASKLIKESPPACVIGMGGYLSFPVLLAAMLAHVPTLIHEQNVVPGLANRTLARMVNRVAVSFEESRSRFPKNAAVVTGLPVRSEMTAFDRAEARRWLELDTEAFTILIFGGSQGSQHLNAVIAENWKRKAKVPSTMFQIIHITGERDFPAMEQLYKSVPFRARLMPYCHTMPMAYAAADVVICRAGASTIAELIAVQRISVLVPFPHASENHQLYNAQILANGGVAEILPEAQLTPVSLNEHLTKVLTLSADAKELEKRFMRLSEKLHTVDATVRLAQQVEMLVPA